LTDAWSKKDLTTKNTAPTNGRHKELVDRISKLFFVVFSFVTSVNFVVKSFLLPT
jgi:hypothetical protein